MKGCFEDNLIPLQQFFLKNEIKVITKHLVSLKEIDHVVFMESLKKIMERHSSLREIFFKSKNGRYKVVVADIEQIASQSITYTELNQLAEEGEDKIKRELMGLGDRLIEDYLDDFEGKVMTQFKLYKIGKRFYILGILNHLIYGKKNSVVNFFSFLIVCEIRWLFNWSFFLWSLPNLFCFERRQGHRFPSTHRIYQERVHWLFKKSGWKIQRKSFFPRKSSILEKHLQKRHQTFLFPCWNTQKIWVNKKK